MQNLRISLRGAKRRYLRDQRFYKEGENKVKSMMQLEIKAGKIIPGKGKPKGVALVSRQPISFLASVNHKTGKITEKEHELKGVELKNKILVLSTGKGSTVSTWGLYELAQRKLAPKAIILKHKDSVVASGAILGKIWLAADLEKDPLQVISSGDIISIDENKKAVIVGAKPQAKR